MNLREQYAAARKAAQDIHDQATAEGRAKTDAEQATFDAHLENAKRLKAMIDQVAADNAAIAELGAAVDLDDRVTGRRGGRRVTAGHQVVDSDAYKRMIAANPGGPQDGVKPHMDSVRTSAFMNSVTVSSGMNPEVVVVTPDQLSVIDIFSAINVVDLTGPDAPDSIKIYRTAFTNNAAVVTMGDEKPESNLVITEETVNPETIAHHTPINKKHLWHSAMLQNKVNVHLVNGVRAKAQSNVAAALVAEIGGGNIQQQGFDTDIATTLRKAVTKAQRGAIAIGGNPADIAIALSPEDHESLDLELLAEMVALAGQELSQTSRIWRSRIVPLFGLTEGVAFVGDLKQVSFYVTHDVGVTTGWVNDQFIRNQLTMLGEMEAVTAVEGAAAIVAADLASGSDPDFS